MVAEIPEGRPDLGAGVVDDPVIAGPPVRAVDGDVIQLAGEPGVALAEIAVGEQVRRRRRLTDPDKLGFGRLNITRPVAALVCERMDPVADDPQRIGRVIAEGRPAVKARGRDQRACEVIGIRSVQRDHHRPDVRPGTAFRSGQCRSRGRRGGVYWRTLEFR